MAKRKGQIKGGLLQLFLSMYLEKTCLFTVNKLPSLYLAWFALHAQIDSN